MADRLGSGKSNNSVKVGVLKGLSNRSPKVPDTSMKLKGGSVNDNATRSSTAKQGPPLGPRVA